MLLATSSGWAVNSFGSFIPAVICVFTNPGLTVKTSTFDLFNRFLNPDRYAEKLVFAAVTFPQ